VMVLLCRYCLFSFVLQLMDRGWCCICFNSVVTLTLSLLMSYICGAPCKARNFNVVQWNLGSRT
jgi:hypothetical protein